MKNEKVAEAVAVCLSLVGILGAAVVPFRHETESLRDRVPPEAQVLTLTAVADAGLWTEEDVSGGNYWRSEFHPARPVLRAGKPALLRLKSADVVHVFYSPGLGIDPIEVYPGHVVEILVTPAGEGVFGYYCTMMCGDPHFAMRGVILVQDRGVPPPDTSSPKSVDTYWLDPPPAADAELVERGEWLFHRKGCATCHGKRGEGGVRNPNYVNDTVPALNSLAEKMFLYFPEDVEPIIDALEQRRPLDELSEDPPVRRFAAVLAQYDSIKNVIRKGNPAGKKDPAGPYPPLEMPAWEYQLSEEDIDAVIAYLLSEQPREEAGE